MVKPRKLSGSEKTIQITKIIMYAIGFFIGLMILLVIIEYYGFFTDLKLRLEEMFNI